MRAALFFQWSTLACFAMACGGVADATSGGSGHPSGPGAQNGQQPADVVAPPTRELPPGDCHAAAGATPKVLFAPFVPDTQSYPTPNSLAVSGNRVYAALRGASTGPNLAPVAIYVGSSSPGAADFQPLATIAEKQFNFEGGPTIGAHHVYWWQQLGSEWTIEPSHLAFRDADGSTHDVVGTDVTYAAATVVDGDELFALTCADERPDNTQCASPTSHFTLFDARLDTGTRSWTKDLPATSGQLRAPMAVDDRWVYWAAPPDGGDSSKPPRVLRVARAGGDVQELKAGLSAGESIARIVIDGGDVDLVVLSGERAGTQPRSMALAPIAADGTIRPRVSLHATGALTPLIALDASSVYFTYDDGAAWPDTSRTLARACRDGSNTVTLVQGWTDGSATRTSVADLAIDAQRVYFTSANQVLSIDK